MFGGLLPWGCPAGNFGAVLMKAGLMQDSIWEQRLVMFVKAPKAGRAKTRLARDIGKARAAGFYRHATRTLADRLGADKRWETLLAVDPVSVLHTGWHSVWPAHVPRVSQGQGDLGDRMALMFTALPPGPVVVIGTDAPQISTEMVAKAFALLRGVDLVVSPAPDGGYSLIGMRRLRAAPGMLLNVRWSTEHTLDDTLASLPKHFTVARLPEIDDIDEGVDLAANPDVLLRSRRG